jgi:deazaflavin-dependent oxidoreductase (nitroreductase family)
MRGLRRPVAAAVQRVSGTAWFARIAPPIVPRLDRALHRISAGRLLAGQYLVPSIVLTTTGHRTGCTRRAPLACVPEPDGSFVVAGSNFGRENHPAWTENLLKTPGARVGYRGREIPVTARLLAGAERAEAWERLLCVWPVYDRYAERSGREPRVFRLSPERPSG